MGDVVQLTDAKAKREPHLSGPARCFNCEQQWVAVAPVGTSGWLECPQCHLLRGRLIYPCLKADALHWKCHCGNDLFYVTPQGYYCPQCGVNQTGF